MPPNTRWSRRPPLRFNEVTLPVGAAVSQASFARGGGWARLSLAVSLLAKGAEMTAETDARGTRRAIELALFFLLTLVAWMIWVPQARYRLGLAESAVSLRSPANALTVWSPGLAAIVLTILWSSGRSLRDLLGGLGRWRVNWRWYLVALLFEPVSWCLSLGIDRILGRSYELGPMPLQAILGSTAAYMIPVALVFTIPNAVGEEIGWRGFALPRLRAWRGALVGTLVLGAFWGLWHIPAWIAQGLSSGFGPMAVRVLGLVATAFVFTWIYYGSGGSLVLVALYHAAITSKNYLFPGLPTQTEEIVLWVFVLVMIASTRSLWFGHATPVDRAKEARAG
jgi:membrane protease YdiL (CAAX protease family)